MQEETEFDKDKQSISLPSSSRYVTATMLGTIEGREGKEQFILGVYNFPVLDNPVWYVTADDLDKIFDYKGNGKIDYSKDFYLPIGKSPAFPDYDVKICPDQLFAKHAAILGNTGSGKSCTLASILHSLFSYRFKENDDNYLGNAHFIIFDINGEYKNALIANGEIFKRINAFHIDNEGLKVPYWFMNWDDFDYLFEPGAGTQAPILKRAVGLARNSKQAESKKCLSPFLMRRIRTLIDASSEDLKKQTGEIDYGKWKWKENNEILKLADVILSKGDKTRNIGNKIKELGEKGNFTDIGKQDTTLCEINKLYSEYIEDYRQNQITNDKNIDLPTWFNYQELIAKFIDAAIEEQEGSSSRISEYLSTLRLRLESFLNDQRIAVPLLLSTEEEFSDSLAKFLSFILGDFYRLFKEEDKDLFSSYYADYSDESSNKKIINQISILDMSLLAYDVLESLTGLIGRLIIEFVSHFAPGDRGKYPVVLVLEEAQNYIPEKSRKGHESITKKVFERIAREGRKYGVSLIISSQRPAELSKTVLSQCNSFIVHRLQNPDDQKYIKGLVSSANSDILDQLPILPQQHAFVMGDCVRTPVQVRINNVAPIPNSDNPRFVEKWLEKQRDFPDYVEICNKWKHGKR
jgi:Predicted ATPase